MISHWFNHKHWQSHSGAAITYSKSQMPSFFFRYILGILQKLWTIYSAVQDKIFLKIGWSLPLNIKQCRSDDSLLERREKRSKEATLLFNATHLYHMKRLSRQCFMQNWEIFKITNEVLVRLSDSSQEPEKKPAYKSPIVVS